jgi:hypothetical protein
MKKGLASFIFVMATSVLLLSAAQSQVQFQIPVTFTAASGPAHTLTLKFGVSGDGPGGTILDNTYGVDLDTLYGAYQESSLPPPPPTPIFDVRWVDIPSRGFPPFPLGLDTGIENDYRGFSSSAQVDSHKVKLAGTDLTTNSLAITWPANLSDYCTACVLKSELGLFPDVNMLTSTTVTVSGGLAAAGSILIIKTGAVAPSPGPTFSISPAAPLAFGDVGVGGSLTLPLTVANLGSLNALSITSAPTAPANYTVSPTPPASYPISIPALGSYTFNVTFSPTAPGPQNGNIVWTHNAPGSPTSYAVTGTGTSQGGTLRFAAPSRTRFDNTNGYSDDLQLVSYVGGPLKALQFRLITNGILIFRSIAKGSDINIPASAWSFNHVIERGPVNADGSTNDTVKVVLYGNGTTALPPGTYSNLVHFEYDVVNIGEPDVQTTSISLPAAEAIGSLSDGSNAGIVAGPPQTITVNNRTVLGDINNDDMIDILDLLMIVDHILNVRQLTPAEFIRADVAPWSSGMPAPSPDGVVNVQDLALLQNIILTGTYPSGDPIESMPAPLVPTATASKTAGPAKLTPGTDAKLTFHVTHHGIAVRMENAIPVKGLQLEFMNVYAPAAMTITTEFGNGYHRQNGDLLRVLLYNQNAVSAVAPGERIVANIPFAISEPTDLTVENVVVAGLDNRAISKAEIAVSYSEAPELPVAYALSQNYPNPFNPTTSIRFSVPEPASVRLSVYNMLGQEVRTLFAGQTDRGTRVIEWDATDNLGRIVPSGTYVYRMTAGSFVRSYKMMLVK